MYRRNQQNNGTNLSIDHEQILAWQEHINSQPLGVSDRTYYKDLDFKSLKQYHQEVTKMYNTLEQLLMIKAKTKEEFERLKNRIGALEEIYSDAELWESAGRLSFDLRRKGLTIPSTDILIASAALKSRSTLLHADSHFDIIASEINLKVESYISQVKNHK